MGILENLKSLIVLVATVLSINIIPLSVLYENGKTRGLDSEEAGLEFRRPMI